ncbi:MAG: hypothetical protein ABIJ16_00335 [Bacteroidota bacterium]
MEKLILSITLVLFIAAGNINCDNGFFGKPDAKNVVSKFKSKKGKFSISFPGTPTESKDKVDTESGKIDMVTYMYENGGSEVFMVAYSDYPAKSLEGVDDKSMLEGSKGGFVGSLSLEISTENFFTIDGHTGIYFEANNSQYYSYMK